MKDIALDSNGDLLWKQTTDSNGTHSDLDYVESDFFCVVDILDAQKGEYRFDPQIGAFVQQYKLGKINIQDVRKNIDINLQSDGWSKSSAVANVNTDGKLEISVSPKKRNG